MIPTGLCLLSLLQTTGDAYNPLLDGKSGPPSGPRPMAGVPAPPVPAFGAPPSRGPGMPPGPGPAGPFPPPGPRGELRKGKGLRWRGSSTEGARAPSRRPAAARTWWPALRWPAAADGPSGWAEGPWGAADVPSSRGTPGSSRTGTPAHAPPSRSRRTNASSPSVFLDVKRTRGSREHREGPGIGVSHQEMGMGRFILKI